MTACGRALPEAMIKVVPMRPHDDDAAMAPARGRLRLSAGALVPRRISSIHTSLVRVLKILLPAAALAIAALVMLWPQLQSSERRLRLTPVALGPEDLENLRMVAPRYQGMDAQNRPYTLTAEQATQAVGSSEVTELTRPKADLTLNDGTWLAMTADEGVYRRLSRKLRLAGHVMLFHDGGYELQTSVADIDLAAGTASGDERVVGQGPDTLLEGEGFRVFDKGGRILVTGQSRLVISSAPGQGRP